MLSVGSHAQFSRLHRSHRVAAITSRLTPFASAGTVDVGVPQLSMHSIREMCGVDDVINCKLLAQHFLADFREMDSNFGQ